MSDLVEFARSLKERLTAERREPHWEPDEAERYMTAIAVRREKFEPMAARLIEKVIQPRLETLASFFPNASLSRDEPAGRCSYWFGYCEQFPASTRVTFAIEHDVRCENVAVCFELSMMPVFIKMSEHDRLTLALDAVQDGPVAEWTEKRLFEFLDDYLRIDRGSDDFEEDAVTDPVCGMRISRSAAVGSDSHRGHPYFFCSRECRERFARKPTDYVDVKTM